MPTFEGLVNIPLPPGEEEALAVTGVFYDELARARRDPASVAQDSDMAKLAGRLGPSGRIAGVTLGPEGLSLTPEQIAAEINKTLDEQEAGKLESYPTFAEAEAASRRQGQP